MSAEILSMLVVRSVALTEKKDAEGVKVELKVFWKTIHQWDETYIEKYRKEAPEMASYLKDNFSEW